MPVINESALALVKSLPFQSLFGGVNECVANTTLLVNFEGRTQEEHTFKAYRDSNPAPLYFKGETCQNVNFATNKLTKWRQRIMDIELQVFIFILVLFIIGQMVLNYHLFVEQYHTKKWIKEIKVRLYYANVLDAWELPEDVRDETIKMKRGDK